MVSLCHIIKEKIVSKTSTKTAISKVSDPLVFTKSLKKTLLLKQATYIRYILAKLSKPVQITKHTFSDFFTEDYLKIKKGLELVSKNFIYIYIYIYIYIFEILRKPAKFHYRLCLLPKLQVIQ